MKLKISLVIGVAVMLVAAACGGGQPEQVAPAIDSTAIKDSIARAEAARRAYEDSVARARAEEERLRREREEAARREAAITAEVRNMLGTMIHFDFDKSAVRPGTDTDVLQTKLQLLQANPAVTLEIVGNCDERGSDEYNMALGMRRATAAKKWLTDRGIADSRITVKSMGEENPIDPAHNEDAWAKNRRDEFNLMAGGAKLVKPAGM
jgi:peptidoglycan-associated lipoprotein